MTQRVIAKPKLDATGKPVQLTWDLFPLVDASTTTHLDENGLAKPGTLISEGMVLVGRIGRSEQFDERKMPSELEIQGLSFGELHKKYGPMWKDHSVYASSGQAGVVRSARLETTADGVSAVVELVNSDHAVRPVGAGSTTEEIEQ